MGNYLRGKRGTQRRTGTIKAKGVEQFRGESGHDADDAVKSGERDRRTSPGSVARGPSGASARTAQRGCGVGEGRGVS